ncbi:MAG: ribosomal-processing cysteine protease Prp [Spirochaetota bacterium]
MIEIYLSNLIHNGRGVKAGSGKEIKIKVTGHAGFGKTGTDIVCAAVSAVVQTSVISITKVARVRQKIRQKQGFLESVINISRLDEADLNNLILIINTMLTGLEEILTEHPEALIINFERRG